MSTVQLTLDLHFIEDATNSTGDLAFAPLTLSIRAVIFDKHFVPNFELATFGGPVEGLRRFLLLLRGQQRGVQLM